MLQCIIRRKRSSSFGIEILYEHGMVRPALWSVMTAVATQLGTMNDQMSRRARVCELIESTPWSVVLIDAAGAIAAASPSARRLLNVQSGSSVVDFLSAHSDGQTRAHFEQLLACASNNVSVHPYVFQRHEPSLIEIEIAPISIDNSGWVSVTVYESSRKDVVQRLIQTLHTHLLSLYNTGSLRETCDRLSALLLPAGMSLAVIARNGEIRYASPPFETVILDTSLLESALHQNSFLFVSSLAAEPSREIAQGVGSRGHIVCPLPGIGRPAYVLHLWGSAVAPDVQEQTSIIAALIASLLAHSIGHERATRRQQRLDALVDLSRTILSLTTTDDALREICRQTMTLLEADHVGIYLPTNDPNILRCVAVSGAAEHLQGRTLPVIGSLVGRTFREGTTLTFTNLDTEEGVYRPFWEAHHLKATLLQPLYDGERVVGVLAPGWYTAPELHDDDYQVTRQIAALAAAVVANIPFYQPSLRSEPHDRLSFERTEKLVFSLAPDGNILRCNQSATIWIGAKPGASFFDFVVPACKDKVQRYLQDAAADQHLSPPWTFEVFSVQGQPIALETTAQVIRLDSSATEIDLICRDVTAQRTAEQEMQQLHLELTTLLCISQTINRATDLDEVLGATLDILIQAMNIHAAAIVLHSADGRLQLKDVRSLSQTSLARCDHLLTQTFPEEQEALTAGTSQIIDIGALRTRTPDMPALTRLPNDAVYLAVVPLVIDGVVIGLLDLLSKQRPFEMRDMELAEAVASQLAQAIRNAQTNQDMRETSMMNARLYREAEAMRAYLDAIIQNAPDVLIVCRPDMSMQPLNQEPLTALGYQRHELAGQSLLRLVPPDHRVALTHAWLKVRQSESQRFEMDLLRADDSRFTALVSFDLIPDYDEVLIVIKDVTELRRLEAQVRQHEKLAALGRLIAGAAHELNNPLAVILGLSQLQLGEDIPLSVRSDLEQIERAARRAAAIVHQLRAFGQRQTPEFIPLDLSAVINETLQRLEPKIAEENITITIDLPPDLPYVLGEMHQIEQVVFNIALNAIQALALRLSGEPRRLRFSARADAESVVLVIEDTGPGIEPEHLSRIFEPFFTTRDVGQGMGMGLAVVYSIVQQHRGEVWVESRKGVGTTFSVRLLRTDETPQEERTSALSIPRHLSILLVEDDDLVRAMAQRALERLECRVDAVSSGDEALARALAWNYDLVITDLQMPGLDGVELYERLRVLKPSLRWLILTGDTMGERSSGFLQRTGAPVLHKPFTHDQLIESIAASLQRDT